MVSRDAAAFGTHAFFRRTSDALVTPAFPGRIFTRAACGNRSRSPHPAKAADARRATRRRKKGPFRKHRRRRLPTRVGRKATPLWMQSIDADKSSGMCSPQYNSKLIGIARPRDVSHDSSRSRWTYLQQSRMQTSTRGLLGGNEMRSIRRVGGAGWTAKLRSLERSGMWHDSGSDLDYGILRVVISY